MKKIINFLKEYNRWLSDRRSARSSRRRIPGGIPHYYFLVSDQLVN